MQFLLLLVCFLNRLMSSISAWCLRVSSLHSCLLPTATVRGGCRSPATCSSWRFTSQWWSASFLESSAPVGPSITVPSDLIKITVRRMFATNNGLSLVTGVRLVWTGKPIVFTLHKVNWVCKDAPHPSLLGMVPAAWPLLSLRSRHWCWDFPLSSINHEDIRISTLRPCCGLVNLSHKAQEEHKQLELCWYCGINYINTFHQLVKCLLKKYVFSLVSL